MERLCHRLSLILLVLVQPLAVAGQNIGAGVVTALLLVQLYRGRRHLEWGELWRTFKVPMVASCVYLGLLAASTALNPANPARFNFNPVAGHIYWMLLPPAFVLVQRPLAASDWHWLARALAVATGVLGIFAVTQAIWGWQLVGSHFEPGPTRAQGLYSHPLSYAYVCLLYFPLGCVAVARWPRRWESWVIALAMGVGIAASWSRTVEVVAAVVVLANVWRATRGRQRLLGLGGLVLAGGLILMTPNPIGEKFRGMLVRHDVRSDYPVDDRLAFWHANFEMFLERPLLGHGEHIGPAYRAPYYEAIGLGDFDRQYEAHDMYLQFAVNGGLVGLAVALVWFGWHFRCARRLGQRFAGRAAWQVLAAFCAGAVTQNAFQDSAVRFTLTVLVTLFWLAAAKTAVSDEPALPRPP